MVALAVSGRNGWYASDIELQNEAPSYTTVTLERLHEHGYAPSELFFVLGADAFVEVSTWKNYPHIFSRANFAVVARPGYPVSELSRRVPVLSPRMTRPPFAASSDAEPLIFLIDAQTADVSSTEIRRRRTEGQSIARLVPPGVQQHNEQHHQYSSMAPGRGGEHQTSNRAAGGLHGQD
jgi:nicotinate-nucleotide adenylyltransferase